jgi:hypothetical protein
VYASVLRPDLRGTLTVTDLFNRGTACCLVDVALLPQPDGTVTVARHPRDELPRLVTFGISWRCSRAPKDFRRSPFLLLRRRRHDSRMGTDSVDDDGALRVRARSNGRRVA